jgi:RimJ/RimL family protein N-acetyltransferase
VEVRPGTPADVDAFLECLDSVARERRFLAMVEAPPPAAARAFLDDAWAHGMILYLAVEGVQVVGWCDVTPMRWEGLRHSGRLGMGVLKPWRGRGIGTRLLVTTLTAARDAGLRRVELDVFASNTKAIALYERQGFVREGVKRDARIIDGIVDDLVCMALLFEPDRRDPVHR